MSFFSRNMRFLRWFMLHPVVQAYRPEMNTATVRCSNTSFRTVLSDQLIQHANQTQYPAHYNDSDDEAQ